MRAPVVERPTGPERLPERPGEEEALRPEDLEALFERPSPVRRPPAPALRTRARPARGRVTLPSVDVRPGLALRLPGGFGTALAALVLVLALVLSLDGQPLELPWDGPASPPTRPTPRQPGPGFVAYTGEASEPVRFVVHGSPNRMAALPGAVLYGRLDDPGRPPLRMRLGNLAVEPEVDQVGANGRAETIRYRSAWPGVDAVVRTSPTGVGYDFIVQPGADPSVIELEYVDATELTVGRDGRLRGRGPSGEWADSPPESWQDGPAGPEMVASSYELRGGGRVGFTVGPYDPSRPLVVDPDFVLVP
jgi:hypothetical protein